MFKGSKLMFKGSKLLTLREDRAYLRQFISIISSELVSTTIEVRTQWMWRFSTKTKVSTNLSSSCFNSNYSALYVEHRYVFHVRGSRAKCFYFSCLEGKGKQSTSVICPKLITRFKVDTYIISDYVEHQSRD